MLKNAPFSWIIWEPPLPSRHSISLLSLPPTAPLADPILLDHRRANCLERDFPSLNTALPRLQQNQIAVESPFFSRTPILNSNSTELKQHTNTYITHTTNTTLNSTPTTQSITFKFKHNLNKHYSWSVSASAFSFSKAPTLVPHKLQHLYSTSANSLSLNNISLGLKYIPSFILSHIDCPCLCLGLSLSYSFNLCCLSILSVSVVSISAQPATVIRPRDSLYSYFYVPLSGEMKFTQPSLGNTGDHKEYDDYERCNTFLSRLKMWPKFWTWEDLINVAQLQLFCNKVVTHFFRKTLSTFLVKFTSWWLLDICNSSTDHDIEAAMASFKDLGLCNYPRKTLRTLQLMLSS